MNPVVRAGTATAPDGAILAWTAEGEGPLALIACNGIGASASLWQRLARHFAGLGPYTFVTWDYRGNGRSPMPADPGTLTVAGCGRDLWTVADAAGCERAVLLGYSIGAQVILEAYRQERRRVLGLVPMLGVAGQFFAGMPGAATLEPALRMLIEVGTANAELAGRALRALLRLPGVLDALRAAGIVQRGPGAQEQAGPDLSRLARLDLRGYFALARDLLSHDASDVLETIEVSTLVIAGERDRFTPLRRSQRMAARIRGAELLVLRGGTHTALAEQAELVALALEKFLERIASAPTSAGT